MYAKYVSNCKYSIGKFVQDHLQGQLGSSPRWKITQDHLRGHSGSLQGHSVPPLRSLKTIPKVKQDYILEKKSKKIAAYRWIINTNLFKWILSKKKQLRNFFHNTFTEIIFSYPNLLRNQNKLNRFSQKQTKSSL